MAQDQSEDLLDWKRGNERGAFEANAAVVASVQALIKARNRKKLLAQLETWAPEDVVELLVRLPLKQARRLFEWMDIGPSAGVLAELNPEFRAAITEEATMERLRDIIDNLPADAALETLAELPEDLRDRLLPDLAAREAIEDRLRYARDTAGRVMSPRLLALSGDASVDETIATIRDNADLLRKLDQIYVIDEERRPVGAILIRRLLLLPGDALLRDVMKKKFPVASADMDQEVVGRLAARGDLRSVPVVDGEGRLIGQIARRDLDRIAGEEAEEDLKYISRLPADAHPTDPIRRIVKGRLPWLMAGLVGATIAATVVGSYEEELQKAAILAAFIPVVMSLAGNAGLQASAVTVQALATGSVWARDLGWRFLRELGAALINGATAGITLAALIMIAGAFVDIHAPDRLALSVALSLVSVITLAALVGAFVPMALDKAGIDPAIATGVFITTSNDVLGVLVFFVMATGFYLG